MQEEKEFENGITLVDLFNMLFRNMFLIIAVTVAITIAGVIYTFNFVEPTYQSSSDILIQVEKEGEDPNDVDLTSALRLIQTSAEYLQKDVVLDKVREELSLSISNSTLRNNLNVKYSTNSLFINVSYECEDPDQAEDIVNSLIQNAISLADEQFLSLKGIMIQVGDASPGSYASPNKPLNVIISVLLGGVMGVVSALLFEAFHTTIRNKKDLEQLLPDYQVIGMIPEISDKED